MKIKDDVCLPLIVPSNIRYIYNNNWKGILGIEGIKWIKHNVSGNTEWPGIVINIHNNQFVFIVKRAQRRKIEIVNSINICELWWE